MANPWAGEVAISLNGEARVAKLTLGTLAELEADLGTGTLIDLAERFESGRFSARDLLLVVTAGLRGGGWTGGVADLRTADIAGGPTAAVRMAAELLVCAFSVPGGEG